MAREPRYEEIRPRTRRLGNAIVHVAEAGSTMALARGRAEAGAPEGLVVVADRQTAGVGRRGRAWTTVGASLHATLLLRPGRAAVELQLLPLVAGVAAAEAVGRLTRLQVALKWPNDLLHGGRKLGGILVDAVYPGGKVPAFVLVGLGVNGDARSEEFPPDLAAKATSLSLETGRHVCLPALLKVFLERFETRYDRLVSGEWEGLRREIRTRLGTLGRRVRVETERGPVAGVARDLGTQGELVVETDGGRLETVRSGECEELGDA